MGFAPNNKKRLDRFWDLKSCGWTFDMETIPDIKTLVNNLIRWHYTFGYNEGREGHPRFFRENLNKNEYII